MDFTPRLSIPNRELNAQCVWCERHTSDLPCMRRSSSRVTNVYAERPCLEYGYHGRLVFVLQPDERYRRRLGSYIGLSWSHYSCKALATT
jgi:hypothetical protein